MINGASYDGIELNHPTLVNLSEKLKANQWVDDIIKDTTSIITKLILQHHSGPYYDQNPYYVDFDLNVTKEGFTDSGIILSYIGEINWRNPQTKSIEVQIITGRLYIM